MIIGQRVRGALDALPAIRVNPVWAGLSGAIDRGWGTRVPGRPPWFHIRLATFHVVYREMGDTILVACLLSRQGLQRALERL